MPKTLHSKDYGRFIELLRQVREDAGVTQIDLANSLQMTQSQVSKCERGERRLDLIEVRRWCGVLGVSFVKFVERVDRTLKK